MALWRGVVRGLGDRSGQVVLSSIGLSILVEALYRGTGMTGDEA
jgi:hypothetical protein